MQGWGGVGHEGVGWVMKGWWGGPCRDGVGWGLSYRVGWELQGTESRHATGYQI